MLLQKLRRGFGLLLLFLSVVVLVWGLKPAKYLLQTTQLAPADLALPASEPPSAGSSGSAQATLAPESRLLELFWPESLRLGDDGTLRLTVGFPSAQAAGLSGSQTPPAVAAAQPAIYDAYKLVLQSHLDLPGITRTPTGEVSQALVPHQPAVFLWYLRPPAAGDFSGRVWLHLQFVPRSSGREERILLAAQQVDIRVVRLFGLSGSQARLFGSLGLVVGGFLGLDGVLIWGLNQLAKRRKVA
jgi:hypothetical protein